MFYLSNVRIIKLLGGENMHVQPQNWTDIGKRYKRLSNDFEAKASMLEFVAYLSESEFGKRLHPWSSMFELRITQTEVHPFQESVPFLQISPLNNGSAEFRYYDSNFKSKHWVRIADKGRYIDRFESFVEQAGWRPKLL